MIDIAPTPLGAAVARTTLVKDSNASFARDINSNTIEYIGEEKSVEHNTELDPG
jgi:hypothetical protein